MKKYTQEQLIQNLKHLSREIGRTPRVEDFQKQVGYPSFKTYFQRFGSWNNALKLAGLRINVRKDYTKEELIGMLRNKANEVGRSPMIKDLESDKNMPDRDTYERHFGSFNKSLEAAGLEVKYIFRKWTKEEAIKWLRYKYEELGRTPGIRDFDKDPRTPAKDVVRKLFGNWTNAIREAKIPVKRFWSEKELIGILQKLYLKLNRTPTREELRYYKLSVTPFVGKFGGYNAACLRSGLVPNDGRNNNIWKGWEKHCIEMAKVIFGEVEIKNKDIVEGIPDMYVRDNKLFIDAKTCGYKNFQVQTKKYCNNGHKLEFWCVFKGIENKSKKIRYVYAEELAERMKNLGREDLAAKCHQFLRNVFDEGQKVLF